MSQGDEIREYLETGGEITPLGALRMFGCMRLSARIYDLRRQGMEILATIAKSSNGKHYASYKKA